MKIKNLAVRIFSVVLTAVIMFGCIAPTASALSIGDIGASIGSIASKYADAYKIAYAQAKENGTIDQINSFFNEAQNVFVWAEDWVRENSALIQNTELENKLVETVRNGKSTLNSVRDVINNAEELDEEMLSYASRLLDALYINISDLFDLLGIVARIAGENLPPEIENMIAEAEKKIAELGKTAAELISELEAEANEKIAEITAIAEEKIAKLKSNAQQRIQLLGDLLKTASKEEKDRIFEEIRRTEDQLALDIAEIKEELESETAEITAWLISAVDRINERLDLDVGAIMAQLGEAIETIKTAVDEIIRLAEMNETVNQALGFVRDGINNLFAMADQYIGEMVEDLTTFDYVASDSSFYLAIGNDTAYADLFADEISLRADQRAILTWDQITPETIKKADLISISFNENQLSGFAIEQMLGYIATFAQGELRTDFVAYVELAVSKLLMSAVPILKPFIEKKVTESVTNAVNEMIDAFCRDQLGGNVKTELDWVALVGEENVPLVDATRETIEGELKNLGIEETYAYEVSVVDMLYDNIDNIEADGIGLLKLIGRDGFAALLDEYSTYTVNIPLADAVMFSAESYVYSYVQFTREYSNTVNEIVDMNPSARVVLLGHYNAFGGLTMSMGDISVDIGSLYKELAKVASLTPFVHAVFMDNVTFVDISGAQTIFVAKVAEGESSDAFMFAFNYLSDRSLTNISEAGHKYICNRMLAAIKHEVDNPTEEEPPVSDTTDDVLTPIILAVAACSVVVIIAVSVWISYVENKKNGSPDEEEAE